MTCLQTLVLLGQALSKGAGQGSPRMQSLSAAMEADSDESDDDDGGTLAKTHE